MRMAICSLHAARACLTPRRHRYGAQRRPAASAKHCLGPTRQTCSPTHDVADRSPVQPRRARVASPGRGIGVHRLRTPGHALPDGQMPQETP